MSLGYVECAHCGETVGTYYVACPYCGYKLDKPETVLPALPRLGREPARKGD
jgi:hypothetical protein